MYTVRNSLALPALGGQIKSKMIHQLDSSRPGSVAAAAAAAAPTARQLTISTGHTWLLHSVALTHHTVSDGINEVQSDYQRRCYLKRTTKMTEIKKQEWHDTRDEICPSWLFHLNPFQAPTPFSLNLKVSFPTCLLLTLKHLTPQDLVRPQLSDHHSKL